MPYSTCCGAHTNYPEIDICPDCLEHCDWEEEDESTDEEQKELDMLKAANTAEYKNI